MKNKVKNIIVLGAGESGVGAAILAKAKGYPVFVSDSGVIKDKYKYEMDGHDIRWEEDGHTEVKILAADCIIKSPGIPDKAPLIIKAAEKGILIISEIEWASWFTDAKLIGITGTNGKTTTTSLTYHILKEAGLKVGLAGNIGQSFARQVAQENFDYYVLELSSFQLDGLKDFRAMAGILLNITPDHLDRYEHKYENYIRSKFRISINQGEEDYIIYNHDDEVIRTHLDQYLTKAKRLAISQTEEVFPGAYIKEDQLYIGINEKNEIIMNIEDIALKGTHNRYNTMAAGVVSKILDVRKEVIRESMKTFVNVEHRLESVATVREVEYINDSKATNVNSAWYALESMKKKVIWIAGGIDKGNNYEDLLPMVREKVKALICLGKDNTALHEAFGNERFNIVDTTSMKEAVKLATEMASAGEVVLLAPACSSFDLFQNFEDRGRQFKNAVLSL